MSRDRQALAATPTDADIRWTHDGTQVYAKIGAYTIWNLAISSPQAAEPFSVYETVDGKQVHVGAYASIGGTLAHLQSLTA